MVFVLAMGVFCLAIGETCFIGLVDGSWPDGLSLADDGKYGVCDGVGETIEVGQRSFRLADGIGLADRGLRWASSV